MSPYWTKNYRTGIEIDDAHALSRRYEYYDPIHTLPEEGREWWLTEAPEAFHGSPEARRAAALSHRASQLY